MTLIPIGKNHVIGTESKVPMVDPKNIFPSSLEDRAVSWKSLGLNFALLQIVAHDPVFHRLHLLGASSICLNNACITQALA